MRSRLNKTYFLFFQGQQYFYAICGTSNTFWSIAIQYPSWSTYSHISFWCFHRNWTFNQIFDLRQSLKQLATILSDFLIWSYIFKYFPCSDSYWSLRISFDCSLILPQSTANTFWCTGHYDNFIIKIFKCKQCDNCCLNLSDAFQTSVSDEDVAMWERSAL